MGRVPGAFSRPKPRRSGGLFTGRDCGRVLRLSIGAAFLFRAANQFWPDSKQATLWNDVAIALFVLDVFLVMIGWPAASGDASFAETHAAEADEQQV